MSAGQFDIVIEQGATFDMTLTLKDSLEAAINLTDHTFRGKVRKTVSDDVVQAQFTFTKLAQSGATMGQVRVTMSAVVTAAIEVPKQRTANRELYPMIYDIESEKSDGTVYRWLEGQANISPEVTR
jgi:hypothetical protein